MTPETLSKRLEELEKLAKSATPGPWTLSMSNQNVRVLPCHNDADEYISIRRTSEAGVADNQYIAALSPEVVLELIAEIRLLNIKLAEVTGKYDQAYPRIAAETKAHEDAQREKHRLHEQLAEAKEIIQSWVTLLDNPMTKKMNSGEGHPWTGKARAYLEKYK